MKVIKNSEYYKQLNDILSHDHREIDYHIRQAERYKMIYHATKNRHGIYRFINKIAYRRNQYHYGAGLKLALSDFVQCFEEIKDLKQFLSNQEES